MAEVKTANVCERAVAEGFVLLEHDGMLPLKANDRVAVFGRAQFEYQKSGSGSGGLVVFPYETNIGDELKKYITIDARAEKFYRDWIAAHPHDDGDGWAFPQSQIEAPIDEALVKSLAADNDKAIIVISRTCGEAFDFKAEKGAYYLSDTEENTIKLVTKHFAHTCVLLNTGNIIDMSWVKQYTVGTVAYVWQGGQDGGSGVAKTLVGELTPSGHLTDTIIRNLSDHPASAHFGDPVENVHVEDIYVGYRYFETFAKDCVLYPFGYGLTYTRFKPGNVTAERRGDTVTLKATVKNVGGADGKYVLQCYAQKPQGALGNPARVLAAFKKTKLLRPDESEVIELVIDINALASYDDSGKSGFPYSYVLESGEYALYLGGDVRSAQKVFTFSIDKTVCVKKCSQALAPIKPFDRLVNRGGAEYEPAPLRTYDINTRILSSLPRPLEITGDRGIMLADVADGKFTPEQFVAQFDISELCLLVRGEGMCSPKAPIDGTASCFGGVTRAWHDKGMPVMTTVDGPSGIRFAPTVGHATFIPTGTLLASMWSPELMRRVIDIFAGEMVYRKLDVALAPGVNIHRHPLGGRNFEYFSEDPLLTGLYAAATAQSFMQAGVRCTLKHFAVNSQECERGSENEVLSERALREIYLKGFEIAVKSGFVQYIMTSYNRVNGTSSAGNYDLLTTILRDEWGFDGVVMTDWWTLIDEPSNGTFEKTNLAAMVRAQNDVYMVTDDALGYPDDLSEALNSGRLTVGELQRCAVNIVKAALTSLTFKLGENHELFDASLAAPIVQCAGDVLQTDIDDGTYIIEIDYSCAGDSLIQNDVCIAVNGVTARALLLKGTNGKTVSHRVTLDLPRAAKIEFTGKAKISRVTVYKLK